jgi:uncharacterized protein YkwD
MAPPNAAAAERTRIVGYLVVGAVVAVVLLIRALTAPGQAEFEAASAEIGWTDASEAEHLARDLFARVNDERAERGLPAYVWHDGLAELARGWSEEMIATGYRHSDDGFRQHPDFIGSGENIAMGYDGSTDVHLAWMESDSHREAILSTEFVAIGVGVVCRNDGVLWATQIFGVPRQRPVVAEPLGGTGVHPIRRRDEGPTCPRPSRWW